VGTEAELASRIAVRRSAGEAEEETAIPAGSRPEVPRREPLLADRRAQARGVRIAICRGSTRRNRGDNLSSRSHSHPSAHPKRSSSSMSAFLAIRSALARSKKWLITAHRKSLDHYPP
jgi:hypothetical protein